MEYNVVVSADVPTLDDLANLVRRTAGTPNLLGYRVVSGLVLDHGLPAVVETIQAKSPDTKVVYDHQSGATSAPEVATAFADSLDSAEVNFAVLYPLSGPPVLSGYVSALRERGQESIVGCVMPHIPYIEHDGGWMVDGSPHGIFDSAWECGVRHFELPSDVPLVAKDLMDHVMANYYAHRKEITLWMTGRPSGGVIDALERTWGVGCVNFVIDVKASGDPREMARDLSREIRKGVRTLGRGR